MKSIKSYSSTFGRNFFLVTILLFILAIAAASISSHLLVAGEATKSAKNLRDATILQVEKVFQSVEISVKSASSSVYEHIGDRNYPFHATLSLVERHPNVVGAIVAFREGYLKGQKFWSPYSYSDPATGEIVSRNTGCEDYNYFTMEWFTRPFSSGKECWSKPYFDEGGGNMLMTTYSFPLADSDGRPFAVMTADIALDWLVAMLEQVKPYPSSQISLIDQDGEFVCGGDFDYADKLSARIISGEKDFIKFSSGSTSSFAVFGQMDNGWYLVITCDYKEVLALGSLVHMILVIIALAVLTAAFVIMRNAIRKYMESLKVKTAANERFESELSIASRIQMAMLSQDFPTSDKVDLYALLHPAKEVGGDFYDFFIKGDYLYFAVGDVSGKGVPASLFMAIARSAFRFIAGMGLAMNEVAQQINNAVCEGNRTGMFVTMFLGRINLVSGEFNFCNAGHNPLIVNGEYVSVLPNIAAGVFDGFPYREQTVTLGKGSELLIYTDGVSEAERSDKSQYGEERLALCASRLKGLDARQACEGVVSDVVTFTAGNEQNDDITIMTIKLK